MNKDLEKIKLVSVIVPIYNAGQYLERMILSIINQTIFEKMEVILVNDGSNDNSKDICIRYATQYPQNIRLIHKSNGGVSSARNIGIDVAGGKYIAFVDADDEVKHDFYERLLDFIQSEDADIVIGDFERLHNDGSIKKYRKEMYYKWTNVNDIMVAFFKGIIGNNLFDKLFNANIIKEIRFDESAKIGEDMYFVYQTLSYASKISIDSSICGYKYIIREASAMTGVFDKKYFDPIILSERMCNDYNDNSKLGVYAEAHMMHETCKALENVYKHEVESMYSDKVKSLRAKINAYDNRKARKYLVRRQFFGFLLMKYSPRMYMLIHRFMKIG